MQNKNGKILLEQLYTLVQDNHLTIIKSSRRLYVLYIAFNKNLFNNILSGEVVGIISKIGSFFVGWAISRCLSITPHPMGVQGVVYFLYINL